MSIVNAEGHQVESEAEKGARERRTLAIANPVIADWIKRDLNLNDVAHALKAIAGEFLRLGDIDFEAWLRMTRKEIIRRKSESTPTNDKPRILTLQ